MFLWQCGCIMVVFVYRERKVMFVLHVPRTGSYGDELSRIAVTSSCLFTIHPGKSDKLF